MESSQLFHNMTSFDYPPQENQYKLQILYLVGVVFFSGFLVMILTNSARNKIEKFKSGDIRLRLKNKISILGFNDLALGIIDNLKNKNKDINIEIIVEDGVSRIKEKVDGIFGKRNQIYVFHGGYNSSKNLTAYHLDEALDIYIVGENEENSDFKNLECYSALCQLKDFAQWSSKIYLYLHEQASFTLISNRSYQETTGILDINHHLKLFNSDENWARKILLDIDHTYPGRNLFMRNGKCPTVDSDSFVHLIIFGMSDAGEVIAKTAALSCHFPNFISKGIKSKITVIDNNFSKHRGILGGRYSDFMDMCHYSIRRIKNGKEVSKTNHVPDAGLDILDIEWEFRESAADDILLQQELVGWCTDENEILTSVICHDNDAANINIALGLPRLFFDKNIPIWLHVKTEFSLSSFLSDSRYNNIVPWGMLDKYPPSDMWINTTAKLLNYYFETMDYATYKNDKYTNFDQQMYEEMERYWNTLSIEQRMNSELVDIKDEILHSYGIKDVYGKLEHVRWVTSMLLRGFRPLTADLKKEYEETGKDFRETRKLRRQFYLPYIDSFDNLPSNIKKIDEAIVDFYLFLAINEEKKN